MASAANSDPGRCPPFIGQRLAKALADPLRTRILVELTRRPMSPSRFANDAGQPTSKIARKFRELRKYKCIELVEEKSGGARRGGVERIFRATQSSRLAIALCKTRTGGVMFDDASWKKLSTQHRNYFSGAVFQAYIERVAQAFEEGTIDCREDRHFTWTALVYDQEAWEEMVEMINGMFERSLELQVEAALRMAKSGEKPIPATVALACFESPPTPQSDE